MCIRDRHSGSNRPGRHNQTATARDDAANEYSMQANLTHYEDLSQLEDDIVSFLPTVSDIEVFGCEVDLFAPDTQLPLSEDFHTTLLQQNRLQIVVRPCTEEGHSIWQFQESDRERYPKAVRVPINPRKEIADRAFYAAPMLRHVVVANGINGIAGHFEFHCR